MKITLPNGAIIEPESTAELAQVLDAMGVKAPKNGAPGANQAFGEWTVADARSLIVSMKEGSRKLLDLLLERGDMTTKQVADVFSYEDNRPIGGLTAAISNRAKGMKRRSPIATVDVNGEKRLMMNLDFRAAAKRALEGGA